MDVTKEKIAAENPDIAEAFRAEGRAQTTTSIEAARKEGFEAGKKEGTETGAKAERDRLSSIDAAFKGFDCYKAIADELKADANATEATAHARIVGAEREAKAKAGEDIAADASEAPKAAPLTNVHGKETPAAEKTGAITLAEAETMFAENEKLQAEFDDAESYFHYRKNS